MRDEQIFFYTYVQPSPLAQTLNALLIAIAASWLVDKIGKI